MLKSDDIESVRTCIAAEIDGVISRLVYVRIHAFETRSIDVGVVLSLLWGGLAAGWTKSLCRAAARTWRCGSQYLVGQKLSSNRSAARELQARLR